MPVTTSSFYLFFNMDSGVRLRNLCFLDRCFFFWLSPLSSSSLIFKKENQIGVWRDGPLLRELIILAKDLSLVPTNCVCQLMNISDSSSRKPDTIFWPLWGTVFIWSYQHTGICKHNQKYNKSHRNFRLFSTEWRKKSSQKHVLVRKEAGNKINIVILFIAKSHLFLTFPGLFSFYHLGFFFLSKK